MAKAALSRHCVRAVADSPRPLRKPKRGTHEKWRGWGCDRARAAEARRARCAGVDRVRGGRILRRVCFVGDRCAAVAAGRNFSRIARDEGGTVTYEELARGVETERRRSRVLGWITVALLCSVIAAVIVFLVAAPE